MKREPGFYWIRVGTLWKVAQWLPIAKRFVTTYAEAPLTKRDVDEVSDRLLNPDEQADEDRLADRPGEDN